MDSPMYCKQCKSFVEIEGKLDAAGIQSVCVHCGTETNEKETEQAFDSFAELAFSLKRKGEL